ncbi:zinc-finger domain-containing protein [Acuticoccus sp. MNP-M23]|uniref:zinc-finger domain-containing protein n=1 Tax=Acuticoccus sp. MNP-M23 TaxID=3072793 RepID=UPI002816338D|nr:zinc-finger domain-containing protein [Acuticoccus sp. MNP-M23]WMS42043.1 zinc-finger domain-containing protein [Acuticoccus sp. MNP-M23]
MAEGSTPLFHNDIGARRVRIGAKEFMCMGASPPFDHPHEFLDMGGDTEAICPYCSTVYVYDPALGAHEADPASCVAKPEAVHGKAA